MKKEIAVGILFFSAAALLVWGYNFIKGINILKSSDLYYVEYDNIEGLEPSNQVFWRGMPVGLVKEINPKYEDKVSIEVTLDLNTPLRMPNNTRAIITSDGIMGGKIIRLDFDDVCTNNCLQPGDKLIPATEGLIGSMVSEEELQSYMNIVERNLGGILDTLSTKITEEDSEVGKIMRDMSVTMTNLKNASHQMNTLMNNSSRNLSKIAANLEKISSAVAENNESIGTSIQNVETITTSLSKARLDSTISLTNKALGSTQQSLEDVSQILHSIQNDDGTLSRLIKDESLYENLNSSSKQLDLLLQDFRLNPKRYVNVSVFGKKQKEYELPKDDPATILEDTVPSLQ